ncbi:MAG: MoxR family ATPase [Planctomycetota bacterium]|nr:MoxR family ATPase [Planctomycetota bacterium]
MVVGNKSVVEIRDLIVEGLSSRIIGQKAAVQELLTAFFAGGHILVIGVPGLAKTLLVRTLSELLDLQFSRVQFTPDLMPQDIAGTTILSTDDGKEDRSFRFRKGPIFANLLLADEINRTPPKTQAALLEAMEEGQVSVMGQRHKLPDPFFVMATQNPLDQEGTYPLPFTQLDRFTFQIALDYPLADEELDVVTTTTTNIQGPLEPVIPEGWLRDVLESVQKVHIPDHLLRRATRIVRATRPNEEDSSEIAAELLSHGSGPRGVQAVLTTSRAWAALDGRDTVTNADLNSVLFPAIRHRLGLSVHAQAEGLTPDEVLQKILDSIDDRAEQTNSGKTSDNNIFRRWLGRLAETTPPFRKKS